MDITTFYAISVKYNGDKYYAIKPGRRKVPTIIPLPKKEYVNLSDLEAKELKRCLFTNESEARELLRFMQTESTFDDIRMDKIDVR